jgi:hypothetical protein
VHSANGMVQKHSHKFNKLFCARPYLHDFTEPIMICRFGAAWNRLYELTERSQYLFMRGFQPFLFGLNAVYTISAKSSQHCGDKVSLSDRPYTWMSSYRHNAMCELTVNCVLT